MAKKIRMLLMLCLSVLVVVLASCVKDGEAQDTSEISVTEHGSVTDEAAPGDSKETEWLSGISGENSGENPGEDSGVELPIIWE